jgi:hypothetical protein
VSDVHDARSKRFKKEQESARKDIERAFGVLQSRWAVIRGPAYGWSRDELSDIMTACIIMHNMIIETEGRVAMVGTNYFPQGRIPLANTMELAQSPDRAAFVQRKVELQDQVMHRRLQRDLIEHMWQFVGSRAE